MLGLFVCLISTRGPQAVLKLSHLYFLRGVTSDRVTRQIQRGAEHALVLSLCMVVKMGEMLYCEPVCRHVLQEVLGFILMQLKKMKSGSEEHAAIGRSGSLYLLDDFVRLYKGNRNVGRWIGLVFQCFKYLLIFKSGLKQMLCGRINYLSK